MAWIVFIIGSLIMACCLVILATPKFLRVICDFFCIGSRLYLVGLVRIALGVMLLILAPRVRLWSYVMALGLVLAASGLSFFFLALRRTKKLLSRLRNQTNLTIRIHAIIALIIWVLLFYALLPAIPAFLPH